MADLVRLETPESRELYRKTDWCRTCGRGWELTSLHAATVKVETLEASNAQLLNGCEALVGLIQLVCARDDMPPAIREALETNHRVYDARTAITNAKREATT